MFSSWPKINLAPPELHRECQGAGSELRGSPRGEPSILIWPKTFQRTDAALASRLGGRRQRRGRFSWVASVRINKRAAGRCKKKKKNCTPTFHWTLLCRPVFVSLEGSSVTLEQHSEKKGVFVITLNSGDVTASRSCISSRQTLSTVHLDSPV